MELQRELQELFARRGFVLRKWKSSKPMVLHHLPSDLIDQQPSQELPTFDGFMKVLGLEWSMELDTLRFTVNPFLTVRNPYKWSLASDIVRVYDTLGWFFPLTIKLKILLQQLWMTKTR